MKKVAIIGLSGDSLFYNIDSLPKKGETKHANYLHREVGGKGFNQAVALARQGVDVYFLGAVGSDDIGKKCEEYLKQENVHPVLIKKDIPSACASILKAKDGNNEVIVYKGASDKINLDDLEEFYKYIDICDCILLTYEIPYDVLETTIKYAKKKGKMIILNSAPYIYDDMNLIQMADVVCPNETEVIQMFKMKKFQVNKILKLKETYKIKNLVVTLGDKGTAVYNNGKVKLLDAVKVDAVDTTGAGDVFCACMSAKLLEGSNLFDACLYANQEASKSVCIPYVLDAIPRRENDEK